MTSVTSTTSTTTSSSTSQTKSSYSLDRSGLSASDVVDAKLQPYLDRIDSINSSIATNQAKVSAYQSMTTLLANLQSVTEELLNPDTSTNNIFNSRSATLSSSDSSVTASSILSATVASGTEPGTHTVVVSQIATAQRIAGSVSIASRSTDLGLSSSATLTIGAVGGSYSSATISLNSTMSLDDVVSAINNAKSTTGVSAQVLTVSDGSYKLMLTATDTNEPIALSDNSSGSVLSALGLTGSTVSSLTSASATSGSGVSLGIVDGNQSGGTTTTGTFTLGNTSGTATITLNDKMSLSDIASAINSAGSTYGISATVNGDKLSLASTNGSLTASDVTSGMLSNLGLSGVTAAASTSVTGTSIATVSSAALGQSGSFTLNGATITVASGDSLTDIASAINSATVSGTSIGITATVENGQLLLSSSSGSSISIDNNSLTQALGISGAGSVLQQAQAAKLTVDGVTVTRSSNSVDDVLDGITLDLNKASAGTTVTLGVQTDTTTIESTINMFVTMYNQWKTFVASETATTSDGTADSSAILFGDSTLRNADLEVDEAITSLVQGSSLGAIGISLDENNQLTVDSGVLEQSLSSNLDSIESLFEYQMTATVNGQPTSDVTLVAHQGATFSGTLNLNITMSSGSIASLTDSNGQHIDGLYTIGNTIYGSYGTQYDGLKITYTGSTVSGLKIALSDGIADQIYNSVNNYTSASTGSLPSLISTLQSQDLNYSSQVSDLNTQMENYRSYLLDMYGQYEAQIAEAEQTATMMQQLMAYDTKSS